MFKVWNSWYSTRALIRLCKCFGFVHKSCVIYLYVYISRYIYCWTKHNSHVKKEAFMPLGFHTVSVPFYFKVGLLCWEILSAYISYISWLFTNTAHSRILYEQQTPPLSQMVAVKRRGITFSDFHKSWIMYTWLMKGQIYLNESLFQSNGVFVFNWQILELFLS